MSKQYQRSKNSNRKKSEGAAKQRDGQKKRNHQSKKPFSRKDQSSSKSKSRVRSLESFEKISLKKHEQTENINEWEDLFISKKLVQSLKQRDIKQPFPIQAQSIGIAMRGSDLCGKAKTGSGKTLAFGIPVVEKVNFSAPKRPSALIIVPTRELATQVYKEMTALAKPKQFNVGVVFGGVNIEKNIRELRKGVDILVACTGRLEDLLDRKALSLENVEIIVLDEADQMADMGFLPGVKRIIEQCPQTTQKLLFSATLDGDVNLLIKKYLNSPILVEAENSDEEANIEYKFYLTDYDNKYQTAETIVRRSNSVIVFCRTRHGADKLTRYLKKQKVPAAAIHGGMRVRERQRALEFFKKGQYRALVATDVAARGIHVDNVDLVLQYDMPESVKDFTHRSGRTGRAGEDGKVVGLVTKDKQKLAKMNIKTLPKEKEIKMENFSQGLLQDFLGEEIDIIVKDLIDEKQEKTGNKTGNRNNKNSYGKNKNSKDKIKKQYSKNKRNKKTLSKNSFSKNNSSKGYKQK